MTSDSQRAKTAPRSRPMRRVPDDNHVEDARRQKQDKQRKQQLLYGSLSLAALLIGGIGSLLYWQQSEATAEAARAALAREQTALTDEIGALNFADAAQAKRAVQRLEQSEPQWQQWKTSTQFADLLGKARQALVAAEERQTVDDAIRQLEQQATTKPEDPAAWKALHEQAVVLGSHTKKADKEQQQRLLACIDGIDEGYLTALTAAIDRTGNDEKGIRPMLALAQDLALARLETADHARDAAAKTRWEQALMAYAKKEDASVTAAWDAAARGKVEWQDLLPGSTTADWVRSATAGLTHEVNGESLAIDASDAGDKRRGLIVLRNRTWRNCEIAFDATLQRGSASILLRAGKRPDPKTSAALQIALTESTNSLLVPQGQPAHIVLLVLGNRLTVQCGNERRELAIPTRTRSGSLAVLTEPDTSLRISHMRIKNLE